MVAFTADLGQWWAQANADVTRQMSRGAALLMSVGYQWNLEDDAHAWTARLGARSNW